MRSLLNTEVRREREEAEGMRIQNGLPVRSSKLTKLYAARGQGCEIRFLSSVSVKDVESGGKGC
jgi:hypothetical protein